MIDAQRIKQMGWKRISGYDLAVIGAGPAGIGAAISGARRGLKVALIESAGFAGGIGTRAIVPIYFGFGVDGAQSTAGLSEEFIRRMDSLGAASLLLNNRCRMPEFKPIGGRPLTTKVQLDPEVMKLVYRDMLEEAGVDCLFFSKLVDVAIEDGFVKEVALSCLEGMVALSAGYFIDATGDALVFERAGLPVKQYMGDGMHKSMFFYVGGVTPFEAEYNCAKYENDFKAGRLPDGVWDHFGYSVQLNPGVVQIAVCFAEGDALSSKDMTRMEYELRKNIFQVFAYLKSEMPGFAHSYLINTGEIGVRAGQGIVGRDTVNETQIRSGETLPEPVALASRSFGSHANQQKSGTAAFLADWSFYGRGFSAVPMGALIGESTGNLLAVGRCISSEARVVGTFRMMNTCMTIGEAAGIMISLCAGKNGDVRGIEYAHLRPLLDKAGFIFQ